MAKKKGSSLVEVTENAIRSAISKVGPIQRCDELTYCETVIEALDLIKDGLEARLQELQAEGE